MMSRGKILRMSPQRVEYEAWKQERREDARAAHGDAWTGMNARMPDPETVKRQVNAEIARYLAEKGAK